MHTPNFMTKACIVAMLFFMTSCVKYYDLIKSEFPQGTDLPDYRKVAALYRRTATVYDEFQTKAAFNVLWLSDELRKAYVEVYCDKRGLSSEEKEEMLKRQLEENKHWISFIVLADVRSRTNASLSDPNAMWTLHAKLGCYTTAIPESIKEVDLEPEYQLFFGKTFNLFKTAYLVKIPITFTMADKLSRGTISLVQLVIQSTNKGCTLTWDRDEMAKKRKVLRDEDFYWG